VRRDVYLCPGLDGAVVQQQQPRPRDDDDDDVMTTELSLKCVVDGRPPPSVEWLHNYVRFLTASTAHFLKPNCLDLFCICLKNISKILVYVA